LKSAGLTVAGFGSASHCPWSFYVMNVPHILIVGNDPALAQALSESLQLQLEAVVVDTCCSAPDALGRIEGADYDAILSDSKMPGTDGLAFLNEIRALRPKTPTLLITGWHEDELAVGALRGGAYDFIQKPVDPNYAAASLKRAIQMRQLSRQVEEHQLALERGAIEVEQAVEERTRELREANRMKDEFLATLSHELRTPLTSVLAWARMLRTEKLDEVTCARAYEIIERNAKSQAKLIEDLLDVSRIITGKFRLDVHPVELPTVLKAAVEIISPAAAAKSVGLESVFDAEVGMVLGDSSRLQQVVLNLLSNAVKFTPKGGQIRVRLERAGSQARIIVSDTGKGIGPAFLPYVFERFRQADGSSTRSHSGLGLGLAISRHLVEMHGGAIRAASRGEGQGATFTVELPLAAPQMPHAEPGKGDENFAPRISHSSILEGLRVLVVDDEPDARELLTVTLSQAGAQVTAAASCAEAIKTLVQSKHDVLISDIGMPDQDGYALIRKVRLLDPVQGGRIPAVALTAYAGNEDRARAFSEGFQRHVAKPVEPAELTEVVANLAGRARLAK
jgi:signal transduction histidine kinase